MKNKPLVSILMPVYNAADYLKQAVDSILQQTFEDFEFLIIDDGSTDQSLQILQFYATKDKRIKLTSRPNKGLVASLNEMISQAQGEFLARMDADDISLSDRLARQINFLESHPDVVCVGGAYELIDSKNRLLTTISVLCDDEDIQKQALVGHTSLSHPTVVMRRTAVIQAGGYNPTMLPVEDLDLWLRLGEIGKLSNLEQPVLKYRLHSKSISEKNRIKQRQKARKACEQAWERRKIQGKFEATEHWRPGSDNLSKHQYCLKYGWWAFNSSQRQTAIIYAIKSIQALPFQKNGWKLLACSMFKPLQNSKKD